MAPLQPYPLPFWSTQISPSGVVKANQLLSITAYSDSFTGANALTLGGGGGCGTGSGGGSAAAMPGTPTTAAAPRTPIRTLLSTAIAYVSQKRPAVFLPAESVLPRSAARHLLQPADPVLDRRVRREQLSPLLARPRPACGHHARLL